MGIFKSSKLSIALRQAKTTKDCWEVWVESEVGSSEEKKSILKMEILATKKCASDKTPLDCVSTIRTLKKYCSARPEILEKLESRLETLIKIELEQVKTLDGLVYLYETCIPYTHIKAAVRIELENVLLELLEKSDTLNEAIFVFKKIRTEMSVRGVAIKIFEKILSRRLFKSLTVRECFEIFTLFYKEKDLLGLRLLVYKKALTLAKNAGDQALAVVIAKGSTTEEVNDVTRCMEK